MTETAVEMTNSLQGGNAELKRNDVNVPEIPFEDSSHQFLYIPNASCLKKVISLLVIFFQIGVYSFFAKVIADDLKSDEVPIMIKHGECFADKLGVSLPLTNISDKLGKFACGASESGAVTYISSFAAVGFLTTFVIPDVGQAFSGFKTNGIWSVIGGCLLLIESFLCLTAGALFAAAGSKLGPLDAFLGCVGVVFIHDLDEKIREGLDKMSYRNFGLSFVLCIAFSCAVNAIGSSVDTGSS